MKSYSVKSNAKRFARGVAARFPQFEVEAAEPVEVAEGAREWYPAVSVLSGDDAHCAEVAAAFPDAIYIYGYTDDQVAKVVRAAMSEGDAGVYQHPYEDMTDFVARTSEVDAPSGKLPGLQPYQQDMIEAILADDVTGITYHPGRIESVEHKSEIVAQTDTAENRVEFPIKNWPPKIQSVGRGLRPVPDQPEPLIFDAATIESRPELAAAAAAIGLVSAVPSAELAALAAGLPPRVESSAEEIAARRAARRSRIDAEKVNPTPKPVKINKTKIILDLIKRKGGATQEELETATGWQRHTLRGFIAGTLRKRLAPVGMDIECIRAKGEPTRYVVPMMEADRKGGEA